MAHWVGLPCRDCKRTMAAQRAVTVPTGQVRHHGHGYCNSCNSKRYKPRTPETAPCASGCGRVTRRRKLSAEDYPGTVARGPEMQCFACYDAPSGITAERWRYLNAEKEAFESARRRRGVPVEGLRAAA